MHGVMLAPGLVVAAVSTDLEQAALVIGRAAKTAATTWPCPAMHPPRLSVAAPSGVPPIPAIKPADGQNDPEQGWPVSRHAWRRTPLGAARDSTDVQRRLHQRAQMTSGHLS